MPLKGRKRLVKRLRERVDQVVQDSTIYTLDAILRRTPRQTGRLASSWRVGIGRPSGEHVIYAREGDIERARARAIAVAKTARAGDVVYIVSAQAYAAAVEYGDREHKPTGMVRLAAAEVPHFIAKAVRRAASGSG